MKAMYSCGVCGTSRGPGENCRPCANRRNAAYKLRHKEKVRAERAAYKKEKWAAGRAARATLRAAKKATLRLRRAAAKKKWKALHPGAVNANTAKRFASKMRAMPAWANQFFIEEAYDLARRREAATGIEWHVDHIVPLRSAVVCGLHVENNLRVIPATSNMAKGNRHWPDMPDCATQEAA